MSKDELIQTLKNLNADRRFNARERLEMAETALCQYACGTSGEIGYLYQQIFEQVANGSLVTKTVTPIDEAPQKQSVAVKPATVDTNVVVPQKKFGLKKNG